MLKIAVALFISSPIPRFASRYAAPRLAFFDF